MTTEGNTPAVPSDHEPELVVESRGATQEELDAIQARARERVDAAVERARSLPTPAPEEAFAHVFGD